LVAQFANKLTGEPGLKPLTALAVKDVPYLG